MRKGRWGIAGAAALLAAITALAFGLSTASAATVTMHGTYATPTAQGTIKFTPARAFGFGVEGTFVVDGKRYPGTLYRATGGGTGIAWYFGTSGKTAGNALVTLQPDGTYSGAVVFYSRAGATLDAGTMTVTFP